MDEANQETEVKTDDQATEAPVNRAEAVLAEYNRAACLGRLVFRIACDREDKRLTPYVNKRGFSREDLVALSERTIEEPPSSEDIGKAEGASLAVALEAAAQISEVRLPREGRVREDLESLTAMANLIRQGSQLGKRLTEENPDSLTQQARRIVAKRLYREPEEVEMSPEQLTSWTTEQFGKANTRLGRSADALRAYLGR